MARTKNGLPGIYNLSPITLSDGDGSALAVDANGYLVIGVGSGAGGLGKAEDAAHSSGDVGVFSLAVRNDASASRTGTNGDYSPISVDIAGNLILSRSSTSAVTSVDDTASNTTLIAANVARREVIIANASSQILYIKLGTTATATDYSAKLFTDDVFITSYTGNIDGIWAANSTGAAKITELT